LSPIGYHFAAVVVKKIMPHGGVKAWGNFERDIYATWTQRTYEMNKNFAQIDKIGLQKGGKRGSISHRPDN
jgi:hypothetical protein